jgi:hypothetical protein
MSDVKRTNVPWRMTRPPQAQTPQAQLRGSTEARGAQPLDKIGQDTDVAPAQRKPRPSLREATAAAYKGNTLTGATLDARQDLPPFGFNPAPKEAMTKRRTKLAATYGKPAKLPQHASAAKLYARVLDARTRRAAVMQHRLNTDAVTRAAFEKKTSMQVVLDGRADGRISVVQAAETQAVRAAPKVKTSAPITQRPGTTPTFPGAGSGVAVGAMTSGPASGGSSVRSMADIYAMLARMESSVQAQADVVAKAQSEQARANGYPGTDTAPFFPFSSGVESSIAGSSSGMGPSGLESDDEEENDGFSVRARGLEGADVTVGMTERVANTALTKPTDSPGSAGSMDLQAQKVVQQVQRMSQIYSLISNIMSKYNQAANSAISNTK